MRILWLSNSPITMGMVGYTTIMKNLLPEVNKVHPSAIACNYGLDTSSYTDWNGVRVYGKGINGFAEGLIPFHYDDWKADCLLTCFDAWAFRAIPEHARNHRGFTWISYTPLDTEHPNPRYKEVLQYAYKIIPMSDHCHKEFKEIFPDKVTKTIPVGVDTKIFKPLWDTKEEKDKIKAKHRFPEDSTLVLFAGDSRWFRKSVAENLEGFKIFADRNPDLKPQLFIHSRAWAESSTDFDVVTLANEIGLSKNSRTTTSYAYDKGISEMDLATIYNASDVFLGASRGEGAGIMCTEANSCGTPSIYTDFTAQPQYSYGVSVKPKLLLYEQNNAKKAIPDPYDIADAIEKCLKKSHEKWRDECRNHAKNFDWFDEIIPKYWLPTLEQLEADIDKRCFKVPKKQ